VNKVKRFTLPALVVCLALASTAATCGKHPKHNAVLSLNGIAHALQGIQQSEHALWLNGKVPTAKHVAFNQHIALVADRIDASQNVIDAWTPGEPVPHQLGAIVSAIGPLLDMLLTDVEADATTQAQIRDMYEAIAAVLVLVAGV
jgi:hypothetical protein